MNRIPPILHCVVLAAMLCLAAAGCTADKDAQVPAASAAERTDLAGAMDGGMDSSGTDAAGTALAGLDTSGTAMAGGGKGFFMSIDSSAGRRFCAPVSFEVTAKVLGSTVYLKSSQLSDLAGFVCTVPKGKSENGGWGPGKYDLNIVRFAHFGTTDSPFIFDWVLYMLKNEGKMEVRPIGTGAEMEITLRGHLHFDVLLKGATKALAMTTKVMPEFKGITTDGSPRGVTLRLANGPVGFHRNEHINDTSSRPMISVVESMFAFGTRPTNYFSKLPQVVAAEVLDTSGASWKGGGIGGIQLEWRPTADALKPIALAGYNVYRSATPEKPASWRLIARVPPGQRSLRDRDYNGSRPMAYMVTHRTNYPVFFTYEGIGANPVIVGPVP